MNKSDEVVINISLLPKKLNLLSLLIKKLNLLTYLSCNELLFQQAVF